jgi:hypothetical protein
MYRPAVYWSLLLQRMRRVRIAARQRRALEARDRANLEGMHQPWWKR